MVRVIITSAVPVEFVRTVMQVITPCFLYMFCDSIISWEMCFNLFCFCLAITAVIVTFCKLLLGLAGKSAKWGYSHCHRFGFGACMEPSQLSGMRAKCGLSKLVRAVVLCMEGVSLSTGLMELFNAVRHHEMLWLTLASVSSSVGLSWWSRVLFFQLSLLLEARKGAFQREDWEGGMPRRHATTAQCQPGVPLLLGNPERF